MNTTSSIVKSTFLLCGISIKKLTGCAALLLLVTFCPMKSLVQFSVTNTNDDANEGSLRSAITSAKASTAIDSIVFDDSLVGQYIILV